MQQKQTVSLSQPIKVIIGLGNPGPQHLLQRHNIGFRVVDALARKYAGSWQSKNNAQLAHIIINDKKITLIKPQTYMNTSGAVIPALTKQGIMPENILVVHDELEKPFASLAFKVDGSHRGHNGLRSIIAACGPNFIRLRFGIGRPQDKERVPDYVLEHFSENKDLVEQTIVQAVKMIEDLI